MIVSLKIWDDANGESGKIEIFNRKSFTCRVLTGELVYRDKVEKDTLLEMIMKWHAEVEIIPNDMQTGNFADVYFKC
jgi:hypothetical protein